MLPQSGREIPKAFPAPNPDGANKDGVIVHDRIQPPNPGHARKFPGELNFGKETPHRCRSASNG